MLEIVKMYSFTFHMNWIYDTKVSGIAFWLFIPILKIVWDDVSMTNHLYQRWSHNKKEIV